MRYGLALILGLLSVTESAPAEVIARYAIAPTNSAFANLDMLSAASEEVNLGLSYRQGSDHLSDFNDANNLYRSSRIPYEMIAMRMEIPLPWNIWVSASVGRWQVHRLQKARARLETLPNSWPAQLEEVNDVGVQIDIAKTYASLGLGWQTTPTNGYSIGIVALEYIIKGDSSGIQVHAANERNEAEKARIHAAVVKYARRDYFEPPKILVQYDF